jgi:integrase
MPRRVIEVDITTKTARKRLPVRSKPYFMQLESGLHIGYRRLANAAGPWIERSGDPYETKNIGALADDEKPADGIDVLRYEQAVALIRTRASARQTNAKQRAQIEQRVEERKQAGLPIHAGPYTVAQCIADRIREVEAEGRSAYTLKQQSKCRILPVLGEIELAPRMMLSAALLNKWMTDIANSPALVGGRFASEKEDAVLLEQIRAIVQADHPFKPGYLKVQARLKTAGVRASLNRVLRIMRENGLLSRRCDEEAAEAEKLHREGLSLAAIARRIGRTAKTVKKYLTEGAPPPHPRKATITTPAPIDPVTGLRVRRVKLRPSNPDDSPETVRRKREGTANHIRDILMAALHRAVIRGDVEASAELEWKKVKPFKKARGRNQDYLTKPEIHQLLKGAEPEPEYRNLIEGSLHVGGRKGEMRRLRVRQFDPERGTINFEYSKTDRVTGKSGRLFHLNAEGTEFYRRMTKGRARNEFIFTRPDGRSPWKEDNHLLLKRACARGGIDRHIKENIFRHTWASHAVMSGVMTYAVIADQMGHTTPEMVIHVYGHLDPKYIENQAQNAPSFSLPADIPLLKDETLPDDENRDSVTVSQRGTKNKLRKSPPAEPLQLTLLPEPSAAE